MQIDTPRSMGYRMPAEWEKHDATWLSWPKNPLTFPSEVIESVEETFTEMVVALSQGEKVKILVDDKRMEQRVLDSAEKAGADLKSLMTIPIKSSDVWIRDYGPTFILNSRTGKKGAVKWTFNAWGEKYDDLLYDDITGEEVARASGVPIFRPGIVLEGGSIDVNGKGDLLTTEQCLLNRNRNPQLSKRKIEDILSEYTDAQNIIWLKSGIEGDDTDGHVDDFARFIGEHQVLCAYSGNRGTHNSAVLGQNLGILQEARDFKGGRLEIVKLPMPKPLYLKEEARFLPASYANFYIGNSVVLLPVFKDRNDKRAIETMKDHFPEREIVPIHAVELVYGYGGIHCVTQQEPASEQ